MDDFEDFIEFEGCADDLDDALTIRETIALMIDAEVQSHYLQKQFCGEFRARNLAGQRELAYIFIEEVLNSPLANSLPKYVPDPVMDDFAELLNEVVLAEKAKAECPLPPPPANSFDF